MKALVKIGGTLLDDEVSRRRISRELAAAMAVRMVVVHGGGKQMTRFLAERGVESRFVNGLRVTTPEVLDAVLKVFTGTVNRQFVASLVEAGARAVGLSGIDAALTEAEPMSEELGAVGRLVRANPELLDVLLDGGFLPVVACVAGDRQGRIYNVNADQMAVACASGFGAARLLFLTDVDGVRDASGNVLPQLTGEEAGRLIAEGVATGGMEAKLNAARQALGQGVGEVVIAPGAAPDIMARLLAGEPLGTRLVR
ncbi:MAG: acetylglutamate kinase [Bryobacteraceae bacterium]|nr:acetylglutamate kinase [Bryobacteraceae bacterium]